MTKNELEDIAKGKPTVRLGCKAMGFRQEEYHVAKLFLTGSKGTQLSDVYSDFGFF